MSWEATNAVIKKSIQKGSARLMMLVLGNYADKFGFAWPGIKSLAADTKLSERNIQYLEPKLVASGELEVFRNAGPMIQVGKRKGQRTNLFHITLCEPTPPEHPYFGVKRWCKDFTTKVVQKSSTGGESQPEKGGANQPQKVVQSVAPDPSSGSSSFERSSGSVRTVDKSTRNRTRKCTHSQCRPEVCRLSKEGYDAQALEEAGAVAMRVMNEIAKRS